jgi:hypothetical protein
MELLDNIYRALDTARDTNTLVVRESVFFRQYAKELIEKLQTTAEYKIGYANQYSNAGLATDFVSKNIVEMWHTLHSIGQGDNSLSMKVRADKLANLIYEYEPLIEYRTELAFESV